LGVFGKRALMHLPADLIEKYFDLWMTSSGGSPTIFVSRYGSRR